MTGDPKITRFYFSLFIEQEIFISMVNKKRKRANLVENELYILPSLNGEMREFVKKFKIDMMEHIILSIKFAIEHKLPMVEVFQFKNSQYVITISEKEFESNLELISKFYKEHEIYELCPRVEELRLTLKNKPDEKKSDKSRPDDSKSNGVE